MTDVERVERLVAPLWIGILALSVCVPVLLLLVTFNAWGRDGIDAAGIDMANAISVATAIAVPLAGVIAWLTSRRQSGAARRIAWICFACTVSGFLLAGVTMALSL